MGRANRRQAGGSPDGSRVGLYEALSDGGGFSDQAALEAEEYHDPKDWGGRNWDQLSSAEQEFVIRETESILRGFDGNPVPDGSTFITGVAPGTAKPDPRDPRVSGYEPMAKGEAYRRLEEIKRDHPHRITRGLDLTDFDHVHSLVIPEHEAEQRRRYQAMIQTERQAELQKLGIQNTDSYNLQRPTAREAGAQYDVHGENINLGDTLDVDEGEKARLPGGDFIMGPATIKVVRGQASSPDSREEGLRVEVSTPLGQGLRLLRDPLNDESTAPAPTAAEARSKWLGDRAACIVRDTRGKAPLEMEEAQRMIDRKPASFGYDGKEDYEAWSKRTATELCQKSAGDRELTYAEALRVAEVEFEENEPTHKLVYSICPGGNVADRSPFISSDPQRSWEGVNSRLSPNPLLSGPQYFGRGVNPVVPPEKSDR